MISLNLTSRFLLPLAAALALITAALIRDVSSAQARAAESAFQEHLTSLALNSRFMLHEAAAAYCRSRGMVFHRVLPGRTGPGPAGDFERTALRSFQQDPALASLSVSYRSPDGASQLYVLAPARLQRNCAGCHAAAGGPDLFRGRLEGELVGAFGVSMAMTGLRREVAAARLRAGLIGLAAFAAVGLIVAYLLHRCILRPLADLSGSISRMARGGQDTRIAIQRHDEIGRLEETYNHMVERLNEADHSYMEMLAFVSHELKNPIASMITDARVLADGYLGPVAPGQAQKLVRIIGHGSYLLGLVREYLDLARAEGGHLALRPRPAAFQEEVVEPALELIMPQLQARGMSLERQDPDGPVTVQCDPDLLRIVLVNLLGNAVKYGRDEGLIRIRVERRTGAVRVAVWNEGPGFPAEQRPRLFRRFSRLRTPELLEPKGTGVGLYTAWRIIDLHGGSMDATSVQGEWAEFSLELPQPLPPGLGT